MKWFEVDGAIKVNVDEDTFNAEFLQWLESKGWLFLGVIKPTEGEEE